MLFGCGDVLVAGKLDGGPKGDLVGSESLEPSNAVDGWPKVLLPAAGAVTNGDWFLLLLVSATLAVEGKKLNVVGPLLFKFWEDSLESSPFFALIAARKSNLGISLLPEPSWVAGLELKSKVGVGLDGFFVVEAVEPGRPNVVGGGKELLPGASRLVGAKGLKGVAVALSLGASPLTPLPF